MLSKLYVESANGVLDSRSASATARVLLDLAVDPGVVVFTSDEHGAHFLIPGELFDAFREVVAEPVDEPEVAPKRRGRKPKVVEETPEVDDEVVVTEVIEE